MPSSTRACARRSEGPGACSEYRADPDLRSTKLFVDDEAADVGRGFQPRRGDPERVALQWSAGYNSPARCGYQAKSTRAILGRMNTMPRHATNLATAHLNDAARWSAVMAHDRDADGSFVYAVRSTSVYCRPSCPSRRPRRDRVAFFETAAAARGAGFRACRRC